MRTDEMKSGASKIVLDSYESLFGTDTSTDDPDKVRMIPLDELYGYHDAVEDRDQNVASIREDLMNGESTQVEAYLQGGLQRPVSLHLTAILPRYQQMIHRRIRLQRCRFGKNRRTQIPRQYRTELLKRRAGRIFHPQRNLCRRRKTLQPIAVTAMSMGLCSRCRI